MVDYLAEGRHHDCTCHSTLDDYSVTIYTEEHCTMLNEKGYNFFPNEPAILSIEAFDNLKVVLDEAGIIGERKEIVV